jgi:dihydroorotase
MKLLIKNGHIIDSANKVNEVTDLLVIDGKIARLGKNIEESDAEIIDANGLLVLPGFVDAHCHLREPGFEYKEDIESGTRSAAAGGFTSIACMPNTNPVVDNKAIVSYIKSTVKEKGYVNVFPIAAISKGMKGEELSEIGELAKAGAVAISDDGKPVVNSSLMKKAMQYSSMFGIKVISHCEEKDLADEGVMNEGYTSTIMGLKGIPAPSEEIMVAREAILSEYLKIPIHIAHVSTELSVDIVRNAKKRGVKITAETCPHYFSITEEACLGFNTLAKVNPPLRTEKDRLAVIEGLRDGTIDMIATDHAPHHKDEKNVEFNIAANGLVGFETAFALAMTYLVKNGALTMEELVYKLTEAPSKMLGIDKGTLGVGKDADITIVNPDEEYVVDIEKFKSKSKNSPYNGFKLSGTIQYTIVGGKVVK